MAVVEFYINDLKKMCAVVKEETLVETLTNIGAPCEVVDGNEGDGNKNDGKKLVVEVTPNRPDFFFIEGIARAANMFLGKANPERYAAKKSGIKMRVDKSVASVRPVVMAAIVRGVKIDARGLEYLINAQEKLHETIGRKRKKIAIGIHDFDRMRIGTGSEALEYKTVDKNYSFVPLDGTQSISVKEILSTQQKGKEYAHLVPGPAYPMITDADGAISFPPIINSERTRLSGETINFFIDVTGTHAGTVSAALNMVVCALVDRGGTAHSIKTDGTEEMPELGGAELRVDPKKVSQILGVEISGRDLPKLLKKMGYIAGANGKVVAAPYRIDIMHEMDIVEDIAIAYGYEKFVPQLPDFFTSGRTIGKTETKIDETLRGMGFVETVSPILTSPAAIKTAGLSQTEDAEVKNSKSEEFSIIRPALVLSVLECLARNKTKGMPQRFYEIGDRFREGELEHAVVFAISDRNLSFAEIRGCAQTLFAELGLELKIGQEAARPENELMDVEKSGSIMTGGEVCGTIGLVNEAILKRFGLQNKVAICEMVLD